MKKILVLSSCVALLASSVYAGGFFIGGEGGFSTTSRENTITRFLSQYRSDGYGYSNGYYGYIPSGYYTTTYEDTFETSIFNFLYGLNVGFYGKYSRIYASYGSLLGRSNSGTTHKFALGVDFTPQIRNSLSIIFGFYGGYAYLYKPVDINPNYNFSGILLGGKVGVLYELNEHNEIQLGIKTEWIGFLDPTTDNDGYSQRITDKNIGLYVGYNYKF